MDIVLVHAIASIATEVYAQEDIVAVTTEAAMVAIANVVMVVAVIEATEVMVVTRIIK